MTGAERTALRKTLDKIDELARSGNHETFADADAEFHERLYEGTHNATLAGIARDLRRRLRPLRRDRFDGRMTQLVAERATFLSALEDGRAEEASKLMRAHIRPETSQTES